ncbi:ATP-dependent DNA helicase DinG [Amphritea balenae]|uniref:ATP-dependent DNA helicase DinG n=1 Tax=Amphritea balenae TaxID=452629 RepID=A0A3P1SKZ9_9GAMM|nr:ATP-dependent DNA helicase DinG [Amphritea balenae]RRC97776.1 ATP-dependent DNA helicase DinG [Amphritea balenae]GGK82916.1 ATP-dependent DNA helicase DinG [Amphritea balenae]
MLSDEIKKEIQGSYSQFLESRKLKPRLGQKQMIAEIAKVLGGILQDDKSHRLGEKHVSVIEAGTGTGKTIGYLLAVLPIAKAQGKKVVLSTATVALQEQLLNKDLPEVAEHASLSVTFGLAKGRGRYFCISKAEQHLDAHGATGQQALYEDEASLRLDTETLEFYKSLLNEFASGRWDGDRDNLTQDIDDQDWQPLTSDHHQCTNRRCSNFGACSFFKARKDLDQVECVIANHDIVLSDLALGGGAILPDPAETIYIFDEGHHLADKASNHFSFNLRLKSTERWLNSTAKQLTKMLEQTGTPQLLSDYVKQLQKPGEDLQVVVNNWAELLRPVLMDDSFKRPKERYRYPGGVVPDEVKQFGLQVEHLAARMATKLEMILDLLKESLDGEGGIDKQPAELWFPRVGMMVARMQGITGLGRSMGHPDAENGTPTARWISLVETAQGYDFECRTAPVSAAEMLRMNLWQHCYAAVVTSATLTALGRFDRLLDDLGLPAETPCFTLASPFDHYNAAELYIPPMKVEANDVELHTQAVVDYLNSELNIASGTLVLFSSWRQMRSVLASLDEKLNNRVLSQGDFSKNEILKRHKKRIDEGEGSIIFGLASFTEGVDLPGDYLTEVIITKIPFSVPDDPVDATMAEWIEQHGGNPFMEWSVPMASVRLTQAAGRLLRTEQDRGRIVLLDRRVVTRRYGRQLLDSLPPFRRNIS